MPSRRSDVFLGVDLGGTKIEVAGLDRAGQFLLRERLPTPQGDYDGTLRAIAQLVELADRRLDIRDREVPVGFAIPGTISPATGHMKNANSTVLNGRSLHEDLERLLQRPVRLQNDANCLAVSEAADGAARGAKVVFAVILGTGVGAGIALDGRAWGGANAIAGEWGHNPLPWPRPESPWLEVPGPHCWCGQNGCLETWLSGPSFAADHERHTGQRRSAVEIIAAMRAGEVRAAESFDRYLDRLARGLAHIVNVLDPEVIVFGGGMSNVTELYEQVPARMARSVFSDVVVTPLRPARHGDSSGVRGAAWLWLTAD
jgi:fructokinase